MKTVRFLFMACFLAISSVMSAEVITYDFSTPGEDGKIYGFELPTDKSHPTYVTDIPMVNGLCTLTITDNGDYIKPRIQTNGEIIYLQVQYTGVFNFSAERNITKMEFELATGGLDKWVANVGTLSNLIWEGSARNIQISCDQGNQCYVSKIIITLESSDTYTEVASAADLALKEENTNVVFTSETVYVSQSADGKYVIAKSGDNIMYYVGESALPTASKNDVISAGIKGKSTIINRIPAIVVENGYSTSNSLQPVELSLDALDLNYIGKLVAINNVSIVSNDGGFSLSESSNTMAINNIFLSEVNATGSNQRADVVGVLAAQDNSFVIHPISIVEKIYSGAEEAMMPDAEVSVRNGNIIISGEWNRADVYNIDGKLIAHNKKEVSAGKGIYMVVVDGKKVAKVMLR